MQHEATTRELADILSVTEKTICQWQQSGVMVKIRHGRYDLKKSLENWAHYQRCVFEVADNPLELWEIRRDLAWSEAHPLKADLRNLIPLESLGTIKLDAAGNIVKG